MATLQQTNTATVTTGSSITISMPRVRKGSLIVVAIALQASQTVSSVSDGTNTYTQKIANTANSVLYFYYSENVAAGDYTVTINTSASATGCAIAREYFDIRNPSSIDTSASANNVGSAALNSGAASALSTPSELIIGAGSTTSNTSVYTAGTGFGRLSSLGTGFTSVALEDAIVYQSGAPTATFSLGGSQAWACGVVTFAMNPSPKVRSLRPHPFSPGIAR